MNGASSAVADSAKASESSSQHRNPAVFMGGAVVVCLLAAAAWFFPSDALSGILFVVATVSSFGMAIQLTKEQKTNKRLIESQKRLAKDAARLQAFLQNARDGIHILDIKGNIIDASDSFLRMLGYTRAETIGMNVTQWEANYTPEKLKDYIPELFARGETSTFETRHRRKDGSVFDVEISGCPIEMDGQIVLFHSSRDIAERKQTQKERQDLEQRYRDIFDTLLSA